MNEKKSLVLSSLFTLIVMGIYYYLFIPAINIQSISFWAFVVIGVSIFTMLNIILATVSFASISKFQGRMGILGLCGTFGVLFLIIIVNIIYSPVFMSNNYSKRITVQENSDFNKDIELVDFNKLPLLDRDSSMKLGDRVMGQLPEMVSQFVVSDVYTQINYSDQILRVTPLEYADIFKYFSNKKEGIKGYITVNSVNGEATLKKLEKGMKYMPSAYFSEDLYRHLRFSYPTLMFDDASFEIDNDGNPFWVVPVLKYKAFGLMADISGIVLVNPYTGETKHYDLKDVPTWVDHVYSADILVDQLNNWGQYKGGFINSIFGQKNVVKTTAGYNYLIMNDDVYLYTGITSKMADESNLGFVLVNLRTKETKFYTIPGAEEFSAMASAQGQVQQMNYISTFPLLINLNNKPTYLVSLKDNAGLVKMYAFIDVVDYQKVTVTDASKGIMEAAKNYLGESVNQGTEILEKEIVVKSLKDVTIDSNTYFYITDTSDQRYFVSVKVNKEKLPFISIGDKLVIEYYKNSEVIEIKGIK